MRESESGTLPRAKVWYGAKPNNRVSQQTQAKSEMLAKGELVSIKIKFKLSSSQEPSQCLLQHILVSNRASIGDILKQGSDNLILLVSRDDPDKTALHNHWIRNIKGRGNIQPLSILQCQPISIQVPQKN